MRKAGILNDARDYLSRVKKGAVDAYGEGREDNRIAYKRAREDQLKNPEGVRLSTSLGTNRTVTMLNELAGKGNPAQQKVYQQMGMGLSNDGATRLGQVLGHFAADLTQDRSRELWWLLKCTQAVGNVLAEAAVARANPNIYKKLKDVTDPVTGQVITLDMDAAAERLGAIDGPSKRLKKGYSVREDENATRSFKSVSTNLVLSTH